MRKTIKRTLLALPGGARLLEGYRQVSGRLRGNTSAHRGYVGGMWDEIGQAQIDFMVNRGLKPHHVFIDVACGSLRAGRHFIGYLDPANYLGLDHHQWLIDAGLKHEVPGAVRIEKRPEFVISEGFEFQKFSKRPDFGIAQSLFSHLTKDDIRLCLTNFRAVIQPQGRFFATFVPKGFLPSDYENPDESADDLAFQYDADELLEIGTLTGWQANYIGDWGHPRGQEMLEFCV